MKRVTRLVCAAASCVVAAALIPNAFAADLKLPRNGWASWEVPAVEDAPAWCCWSWRGGNGADAKRQACRLDRARDGFSNRDDATTDSIRVYARFAEGKIERLRALSATCPVKADTEIQDLGAVPADDSARWLASVAKHVETDAVTRHQVGEDVIAALAIHHGDIARDTLAGIARNSARDKQREQAVFWLAQLRGRDGADIATSVMFNDPDADVRKHAAFAVSESKSPQAATDLIRLATTDRESDVRSQAWFWLAHSGAPAAEKAIGAALAKESDRDVREQAIFALSQLPEERATRALVAVAEDKSLSREERKRAVFWLSQSESSEAQSYLEKVLTPVASQR